MGDYALAGSVTEQALTLHRETGNRMDEAYALDTLGMAKYKQGDLAGAIPLMQQCLAIMQEVGDKSGMAMALTELGSVVFATGDLTQAAELHGRALQMSVQVGDKRRIAFCLEGLAAATAQGATRTRRHTLWRGGSSARGHRYAAAALRTGRL